MWVSHDCHMVFLWAKTWLVSYPFLTIWPHHVSNCVTYNHPDTSCDDPSYVMWPPSYIVTTPYISCVYLCHTSHLQHTHKHRSNTFFGSHHGDGTDSPAGPIKAKGTMTRKSSESLLDSDRPNVPVRASSMEDIHTLSTQTSRSRPGGIPRIVDAVVKLYQPDHSHKYIDISPVRERGILFL